MLNYVGSEQPKGQSKPDIHPSDSAPGIYPFRKWVLGRFICQDCAQDVEEKKEKIAD